MKADRTDRIEWLRSHPEIVKQSRSEVISQMREEKLLSPKTVSRDVNLFNLMRDAGYSRRDCDKFSVRHALEAVKKPATKAG